MLLKMSLKTKKKLLGGSLGDKLAEDLLERITEHVNMHLTYSHSEGSPSQDSKAGLDGFLRTGREEKTHTVNEAAISLKIEVKEERFEDGDKSVAAFCTDDGHFQNYPADEMFDLKKLISLIDQSGAPVCNANNEAWFGYKPDDLNGSMYMQQDPYEALDYSFDLLEPGRPEDYNSH